jgi:hypothetical protein
MAWHKEVLFNKCMEAKKSGYDDGVKFATAQSKEQEAKIQHDIELYKQALEDECDTDTEIRKIARKVLSEYECEGDSYGVPPLEDIVEKLVEKITEQQVWHNSQLPVIRREFAEKVCSKWPNIKNTETLSGYIERLQAHIRAMAKEGL